ncbi:MAG: hypothetical protein LBB26_01775 [Puniceicoccales bacterium]|nr:hypothetical protein [Puniceicoccales bacterium]
MVFSKLAMKSLYIAIPSYCKENSLVFWQKTGRPPQLPLAAVLTVFIHPLRLRLQASLGVR